MLRVAGSTFPSPNEGTVTIEGDNQEEVVSSEARQLAIQTAAGRVSRPGTSGGESPYPVDANGNTGDDLLFGRNGATVAAYRCDYKIRGGL